MMTFYIERSSKMGPSLKRLWSFTEALFLLILGDVLVIYYYVTNYPTIQQLETTDILLHAVSNGQVSGSGQLDDSGLKLLAWALVISKFDWGWRICFLAYLNSYWQASIFWWLLDGDFGSLLCGPEYPHDRTFFFRMSDQKEKEIEAIT